MCIGWLCLVFAVHLKNTRHWNNWWKWKCGRCLSNPLSSLSIVFCGCCSLCACTSTVVGPLGSTEGKLVNSNRLEVFLSEWKAFISRHIPWEELWDLTGTWKLQQYRGKILQFFGDRNIKSPGAVFTESNYFSVLIFFFLIIQHRSGQITQQQSFSAS